MESTNQTSKVPYDPGWNDPPTLSYTGQQQTTPNKPRLNKRVAFPLSGGTPNSSIATPISMPPLPVNPVPSLLPVSLVSPKMSEETPVNIDENMLKEVKQILLTFLEASAELGPKAYDIKRRIQVMEDMWTNGKLNDNVQVYMKQLAHALRDDKPIQADEIHRALMVDHVSAVSSWMPGIKQLVHHCIARSELLAIDKETL